MYHMNSAVAPAIGLCSVLFGAGCSKPLYVWQADLTSTPRPQSFDGSGLSRDTVVILPPATYNHLQGFIPAVSQALRTACSDVSPPIRSLSQ